MQKMDIKAIPIWLAAFCILAAFVGPACVVVLYSVMLWRMASKDEQRIKREQEADEEEGKGEVEAEKKAAVEDSDGSVVEQTQPPKKKTNEATQRKIMFAGVTCNWMVLVSNLVQASHPKKTTSSSWNLALVVFSLLVPASIIVLYSVVLWRTACKDEQRIKREQEEEEEEEEEEGKGKVEVEVESEEKVVVSELNEVVSEKC